MSDRVYLVLEMGIYRHRVSVYKTQTDAEEAVGRLLRAEKDDYHYAVVLEREFGSPWSEDNGYIAAYHLVSGNVVKGEGPVI